MDRPTRLPSIYPYGERTMNYLEIARSIIRNTEDENLNTTTEILLYALAAAAVAQAEAHERLANAYQEITDSVTAQAAMDTNVKIWGGR